MHSFRSSQRRELGADSHVCTHQSRTALWNINNATLQMSVIAYSIKRNFHWNFRVMRKVVLLSHSTTCLQPLQITPTHTNFSTNANQTLQSSVLVAVIASLSSHEYNKTSYKAMLPSTTL